MKKWIESSEFLIGALFSLFLTFLFIFLIAFFFDFEKARLILALFKEFGESIKPNIEFLAIILAGFWTYRLFIKNRKDYPYASIEHNVQHWNIEGERVYLNLIVTVKNSGNVLLPLTSGKVFIQQVRPLFKAHRDLLKEVDEDDLRDGLVENLFVSTGRQANMEIDWFGIGTRKPQWPIGDIQLEPGESEELEYDFLLENTVKTIKIVSYFKNESRKNREAGWTKTTMYDVEKYYE